MSKNWSKIYKKYKGLWVALLDDEETVVGKGKSAQEALLEAQKSGHSEAILMRVPVSLASYVGVL